MSQRTMAWRNPSLASRTAPLGPTLKKVFSPTDKRVAVLVAAVVASAGVLYPTILMAVGDTGFPLDDSWIYQTFARNLVLYGNFVYSPGELAAGMTSPLWTVWLALGYALGIDNMVWAYVSGTLCLFAASIASQRLALALFPGHRTVPVLAAVLVALDARLTWSAFSGMESLLATTLSLALIHAAIARASPLILGLTAGALLTARPEGLILIALVLGYRFWQARQTLVPREAALTLLGIAFFAVPYGLLNWSLGGSPLPTTFYAKQAIYGSPISAVSYAIYLKDASTVLFLYGPAILLLPGLVLLLKRLAAERATQHALPLLWLASLFAVHGLRVPIVFHHGRYLMPLIPIVIVYGAAGTAELLQLLRTKKLNRLAMAYPVMLGAIAVVFWLAGAKMLAGDTAFINDQQVNAANWLAANTPEGSLVATHDIGAIGYFSNRPVFDTAGLVSPEAIPYLQNPHQLLEMARRRGARYLAYLPDWYPSLVGTSGTVEVLNLDRDYMRKLGFRGMVVYEVTAD